MKKATVKLVGNGGICFSKYVNDPKKKGEDYFAHEERIWKEKMHFNSKEEVFITSQMLKNALSEAARYKGERIIGKGMATYTKHFESGIIVNKDIPLGIKKDDVQQKVMYVPLDGKRGGSKRGLKIFPFIEEWTGIAEIYIIDEIISEEVLRSHLISAGTFIGLGSFRPRNNGSYGRFDFEIIKFEDIE